MKSVIIDKDTGDDYVTAFYVDDSGDTQQVCTSKLDKDAKQPLIAAVVNLTECIAKQMKKEKYKLTYLK